MLTLLVPLVVVASLMVTAHESAHILLTRLLGGRWLGLEFRGLMVGVRLSVKSLTLTQVAWTLAAGPLAEALVVALAMWVWPRDWAWWLFMLSLQWVVNVIPWGLIPNDGTRLWKILRQGALADLVPQILPKR